MCVANQQRVRISLIERAQRRDGFRQSPALLIGRGEIVSNVVPNVSGVRLGATERINRLPKVTIQKACTAHSQPSQCARILRAVLASKGFNTGISLRSTV